MKFSLKYGILAGIIGLMLISCSPEKKMAKYKYLTTDKPVAEAPVVIAKPPTVAETKAPAESITVSAKENSVILKAQSYLGTPYRYGGINENGIDCSGLTTNAYKSVGISLDRSSLGQSRQGTEVKREDLRPGDLVFFTAKNNGQISHVGMVVEHKGESVQFIHATVNSGVRYDELNSGYWQPLFVIARRIFDQP